MAAVFISGTRVLACSQCISSVHDVLPYHNSANMHQREKGGPSLILLLGCSYCGFLNLLYRWQRICILLCVAYWRSPYRTATRQACSYPGIAKSQRSQSTWCRRCLLPHLRCTVPIFGHQVQISQTSINLTKHFPWTAACTAD